MFPPNRKTTCVLAAVILAAGYYLEHRQPGESLPFKLGARHARPAVKPAEPTGPAVGLAEAITQESITADFSGNGRDRMQATVRNLSGKALRLHFKEGQLFASGEKNVVVIRPVDMDIPKGKTQKQELQTAATRSTNTLGNTAYRPAIYTMGNLDPLLGLVMERPDASIGAIQTAVLALTENLPVVAFAKFPEPGSDLPSKFDTNAFKVEVADIICALALLRDIGVPDEQLALAVDPQLKIEAMIDPLAHASAMRYYGISSNAEWDYWKHELTSGEESTRHYALYGIARYFPQVALDMLPRWARETRTSPVFRLSAIRALALTERPQALSELRQLEHELAGEDSLGNAAHRSADLLEAHLLKTPSPKKLVIAFHTANDLPRL
jgi:hypothetical protein